LVRIGHFNFGWTNEQMWRAKAHGIQVARLMYLKGWEFLFLRELAKKFLNTRGLRKKPRKTLSSKKNTLFTGHLRDVFVDRGERGVLNYEATNIVNTVDADYWRWMRVKEFWKEYQ